MSVADEIKRQIAEICQAKIDDSTLVCFSVVIRQAQIPQWVSAPAIGRWQLHEAKKQDDHCVWRLVYHNVEVPKEPGYCVGIYLDGGKLAKLPYVSANRDDVLEVVNRLNANWPAPHKFSLRKYHE